MTAPDFVPEHLRKYIVAQDYGQYTAVDHAVWRFLLRQLKQYLGAEGHAHEAYRDGLAKTGITEEAIPRIDVVSRCLEQYGWRAVPVSGFIPPAAFMELQACGILPIGMVMRTLEHLLYTPAPDIVHESAGHAPILIHPEFSAYLHRYAQAAKKAIFTREDLDVYEAIRDLSDCKEHPNSTPQEIAAAEQRLATAVADAATPSEAALLGRLNWWTAEYGLIGTLEDPKIYGAGLLSSLGECRWCMDPKVKKLPLTVDCVEYNYDITEPQPQLFVTPTFEHLSVVLDQLAGRMAFRRGSVYGLAAIRAARTVNTVEYDSGLQVSGLLKDFRERDGAPIYLQFAGPVQLSYRDRELPGHGTDRHTEGFGAPVGMLKETTQCLSAFTDADLAERGLVVHRPATLHFASGVTVAGTLQSVIKRDGKNLCFSFHECRVTCGGETLFRPEWGEYDMAVGATLPSVFGGPADRQRYGATESFVAKRVPPRSFTAVERELIDLYAEVRRLREQPLADATQADHLGTILRAVAERHPADWLLRLELLELAHRLPSPPAWQARLERYLTERSGSDTAFGASIRDGIRLLKGGDVSHSLTL